MNFRAEWVIRPIGDLTHRHHIRVPVEAKCAALAGRSPPREQVLNAAAFNPGAFEAGCRQLRLNKRQRTCIFRRDRGAFYQFGGQLYRIQRHVFRFPRGQRPRLCGSTAPERLRSIADLTNQS